MKELNLKALIGMFLLIVAGTAIIVSLTSGLCSFAEQIYSDEYDFPVRMTANQQPVCAGFFVAGTGQTLSFWLKVPDRRVENQDFRMKIDVYRADHTLLTEFNPDFKYGHFRDSSNDGQYYKIGSYYFKKRFEGYVCYESWGKWRAPYNGSLTLRRIKSVPLPEAQTTVFFIGLAGMLAGILLLAKNRN